MTEVQHKLIQITEEYKRLFQEEYLMLIKDNQLRRNALTQNSGEIKTADYMERTLMEYPETLFTMILAKLTPEDFTYFDSKPGARWYAKKYPVFLIPKSV